MITQHTIRVPRQTLDEGRLAYFRFGTLDGAYILTNEQGRWHRLDTDTFRALLAGRIEPGHAEYDTLVAKGFMRDGLPLDDVSQAVRARKRFVGIGPSLHIIHLADAHGRMSVEVAKDVLDLVMLSTSSALEIRLVSAPGTHDADLLAFLLQYGTEKNRYEGKALAWRLQSDLAALPEGAEHWLVDKRFQVRTWLHGTAAQHAAMGGADHTAVLTAIQRLQAVAATRSKGDWRVTADVIVGAGNVDDPAAVVQALIDAGIRSARVHPRLQGEGAISIDAFRAFYQGFAESILAAGRAGTHLVEERGAAVLARALRNDPGEDIEGRSPGGWGSGMLVYDAQGHIFPSELAADLHAAGDDMFLLGKAGETSYKECMSHPTLRTLAMCSLLECLPGFHDHWTTPFVGVDPVADYHATGDPFPKLPTSADAAARRAISEVLFGLLARNHTEDNLVLHRWSA